MHNIFQKCIMLTKIKLQIKITEKSFFNNLNIL